MVLGTNFKSKIQFDATKQNKIMCFPISSSTQKLPAHRKQKASYAVTFYISSSKAGKAFQHNKNQTTVCSFGIKNLSTKQTQKNLSQTN